MTLDSSLYLVPTVLIFPLLHNFSFISVYITCASPYYSMFEGLYNLTCHFSEMKREVHMSFVFQVGGPFPFSTFYPS